MARPSPIDRLPAGKLISQVAEAAGLPKAQVRKVLDALAAVTNVGRHR